jgi:DNA primase
VGGNMNAEKLKEYIKEDIERIEKVLESVGCHAIWRTGNEVRCATPTGTNHTQVSVNVDTLYSRVYTEGETFRGDIISLAGYFRGNESFPNTFRFLKSLFGLSGRFVKDNKRDPLSHFKQLRKGKNKIITNLDELEVAKFGNEVLSDFVMLPHINFFYEGITVQTQEIFRIGYDPQGDRIIIPHFAWDDIDAIVGMTGRTLRSKREQEEFKIPKYWNYIKGYKKMYNLYGFSHSLPYIMLNNMIIIFEAEKSVMKHWSMTRNAGFSVSVGGHEISDIQAQIILQNTPMDVEIVIAFDKDVMAMKDEDGNNIGEQFLIDQASKFSKYRKTSYIFDTYNILGEKDSPIDKGVKIWNHLLKYRKVI